MEKCLLNFLFTGGRSPGCIQSVQKLSLFVEATGCLSCISCFLYRRFLSSFLHSNGWSSFSRNEQGIKSEPLFFLNSLTMSPKTFGCSRRLIYAAGKLSILFLQFLYALLIGSNFLLH